MKAEQKKKELAKKIGKAKGQPNEGTKSQFHHKHFGGYTKIGNDYYKNPEKAKGGKEGVGEVFLRNHKERKMRDSGVKFSKDYDPSKSDRENISHHLFKSIFKK